MSTEDSENHIVGFGLAGAVLSWQFYWQKRRFIVHDSGVNHASKTAAGLINPVVFRKITKSWRIDELLPAADEFYSRVELELGVKLLSRKSIYRVFASVEESNNWASKMGEEGFEKYLDVDHSVKKMNRVEAPFGAGRVNTIGNLDTITFLEHSKAFFLEKGIPFHEGKFDHLHIKEEENRRYFFCEGFGIKENPFFSYLPLKGSHGEVLIIESDDINFEDVLNKNMFILPLGGNRYKIGATFNWELKEPVSTEEAEYEILEKMNKFTSFRFKVIERWAGIRPTVADRRPLIGQHAIRENMFLFNGLGTKGVMIAPLFSALLDAFAFENGELPDEVNIKRFQKRMMRSKF